MSHACESDSVSTEDSIEELSERLLDALDDVPAELAGTVLAVTLGRLIQQERLDLVEYVQTVRGAYYMDADAEARAALYVQRIKGKSWAN